MGKGTLHAQMQGPRTGPREVGEFPHILMVEGDRQYDGMSQV
jgi:hypothetical protein